MNLHKLDKLLASHNREGFLHRHKTGESGTPFWDYLDKKCKYHNHDYSKAYSFAEKIFRKYIGKDASIPLKILRNNPRYKHDYFFRVSVEEVFQRCLGGVRQRWTWNEFYIDKKTNLVTLVPEKPRRKFPKPASTRWTYVACGRTVQIRKGIHYWELSAYYYKPFWNKELETEVCKETLPQYKQMNKRELRYFNLENTFLE